jgi:RNA-binding protein 26
VSLASFDPGPAQNGSKGRHRNDRKKRNPRAPFSAEGPVHDRTKSTIVVENIPEENFTEDAVRGFFSQFGSIQEVSMQPYKRLAIVKYARWSSANAAYRSPKVIFDNRFVRVFWYKEDSDIPPPSAPLKDTTQNGANGSMSASRENSIGGMEVDMEEFMKRQEEAQKLHEEKVQKKQEVDRQRQELDQRQQELLAKHRKEKARLHAKLAAAAKADDGNADSIATSGGSPDVKLGGGVSSALRAQLAALEEEAKLLGLDPNASQDVAASAHSWTPRGGSVRGRGSFRGRFPSTRGSRGGYRGGRPDVHAAYAAYSIDNRPKMVAVTGVDLTASGMDEALRQHLLVSGHFFLMPLLLHRFQTHGH